MLNIQLQLNQLTDILFVLSSFQHITATSVQCLHASQAITSVSAVSCRYHTTEYRHIDIELNMIPSIHYLSNGQTSFCIEKLFIH